MSEKKPTAKSQKAAGGKSRPAGAAGPNGRGKATTAGQPGDGSADRFAHLLGLAAASAGHRSADEEPVAPGKFRPADLQLWAAMRAGDAAGIARAAAAGADVHQKVGHADWVALTEAIARPEILRALLDAGADPDHDGGGEPPLQRAADRPESAKLLLGRGADPDHPDAVGATPLMKAVEAGCVESVELLVGAGADVSRRDPDGRTALDIAIEQRDHCRSEGYGAKALRPFDRIMALLSDRTKPRRRA